MAKQLSSFQPQLKSLLDGLVGYWKLDSNSNDSVGSNNGTDTSVTYSTGKISNGAVYTGGTSYTTLTSYLGTLWDNPYTVSMWVKANTLDTTNGNLLLWPGDRNQQHFITNTNKLGITCYNGAVASVEGNTSLTTGVWYHAVFVRTGSTTGKVYLNGVDNTNLSVMQSPTNTLTQGFRLASREDNTSANFDGMIDEVGVWNRALSDVEIKALYNSGNAMAYPLGSTPNSTKLYMPLNGNSVDISGSGNHGVDTSISYVGGKFGQGARFNGSTSKVVTPNKVLTSGTEFTVSCWLRNGNIAQSQDATVISNQKDSTSGFFIARSTGGTPNEYSFIYGNGSAYQGYGSGLFAISDRQFDYYTFTLNGADRKIYRNGILIVSDTLSGNVSWTLADPLNFGINPPLTAGRYWNGLIDEVIIENRAWTAQEISLYYRKSMLNYRTKSLFNLIKDFVMTGDTAVFTITGYNASLTLIQRLIGETANFIITAYDAVFKLAGAWRNPDNKSSTTWTNTNKNS